MRARLDGADVARGDPLAVARASSRAVALFRPDAQARTETSSFCQVPRDNDHDRHLPAHRGVADDPPVRGLGHARIGGEVEIGAAPFIQEVPERDVGSTDVSLVTRDEQGEHGLGVGREW